MKLAQRIVLGYYRSKFNALSLVSPRLAARVAFKLFCTPYTRKRNYQAPPIFTQAINLQLTIDDYTVKGFQWKPVQNANGFKILICHGFDSYSYRFEDYVGRLLKEGFEVLAFDAPAHGVSAGTTITILQYRDMILKINEAYGPVDGILAHSFGGLAVALSLEKLNTNTCKRLVLVAPATETTHAINTFLKYIRLNTAVARQFHNLIEEISGNPASWYSVARAMEHIKTPTLWVHDRHDTITPYEHMHHLTTKGLQHVQFEITSGLGHSLYTEQQITNRIINFFSEMKVLQHT